MKWFCCLLLIMTLSVVSYAQAHGEEKHGPRAEKFKEGEHRKPMRWGGGPSPDIFVFMSKLKKENPEEFARLNQLRKTDFKAFITEMKQRLPKRPDFNKIGELKKQERELAKKIMETEDAAEKEKLTAELKQKIKEDFDVMLKEAEARLEMMMQRVTAIRENEEQFCKDKLEFLLRDTNKDRPQEKQKTE
ncbi:MAG: hypothetical protein IJS08_08850 [Victivallales bacterium]|nr:hypothetical protein [Victivallales bacterium]